MAKKLNMSSTSSTHRVRALVEGDWGRKTGRKGGREVYGRGEEEAGSEVHKVVGKAKINATLRNISQSKKCNGREPTNTGRELGLKGTGSGEFKPSVPPLPLYGRLH